MTGNITNINHKHILKVQFVFSCFRYYFSYSKLITLLSEFINKLVGCNHNNLSLSKFIYFFSTFSYFYNRNSFDLHSVS